MSNLDQIIWDSAGAEKPSNKAESEIIWDAPKAFEDIPIQEQPIELDTVSQLKEKLRAFDKQREEVTEQQVIAFGRGLVKAGAGPYQLGLEWFGDPESLKAFNERMYREDQIYNNSGLPNSLTNKAAEFVGTALPYMAFGALSPTIGGTGAGGILLRTGAAAGTGGITGYSQFINDGESRLSNLYKGMAFAAFGQGVIDVATRVPSFIASRYLKSAQKTESYKEADELIKHVKENTGLEVNLDLYQMSSLPSSKAAMVAEAKSPAGVDFLTQRSVEAIKKSRQAFFKVLNNYTAGGKLTAKGIVKHVSKGFDDYIDVLSKNRSKNWNTTLNTIPAEVKKRPILQHTNTKKIVDDIVADYEKPLSAPEYEPLLRVVKKIQETVGKKDRISVDELQELMHTYGKLAGSKTIPTTLIGEEKLHIYKRIFGGLQDDLTRLSNDKSLGVIGQTLKKARDQYRVDSSLIDEATVSTIGKLFKKDIKELNIGQVADKITKLSVDDIALAHKMLNRVDSQLMKDVQGYTLKNAWDKAIINYGERGLPNIDFNAFEKAMPSEKVMKALFKNEAVRDDIIKTVKLVQRTAKSLETNARNPIESLQNIGGILGSGDTTFINIFLAKTFGPKLFRNLATNEGRRAIQTALNSKSRLDVAAAMAVLAEKSDDFIVLKDDQQHEVLKPAYKGMGAM